MDFDIRTLERRDSYKLLVSVVLPRPIAWVSTLSESGLVNAAPFSFFNMLGSAPPIVALGVARHPEGHLKDTAENIRRTGEFVVNFVTDPMIEAMNITAVDFPSGISEIAAAHLTTAGSQIVRPPRIAESPVALECVLETVTEIEQNRVILARVVGLHIDDGYVDPERLHVLVEKLHLVGRMHGSGWYTHTRDLFEVPRLSYEEWQEKIGGE